MKLLFTVGMACMTLIGCVAPNQSSITFESNPPGATISSDTKTFGVAPQTLNWTLSGPGVKAISEPVTATWISGAKASTRMNLVGGQEGVYTFQRPTGASNLEADIQWAIHLKQQQDASDAALSRAATALGTAVGGGHVNTNSSSSEACLYDSSGIKFSCFSSMQLCIMMKSAGEECH